MLRRIRIRTLMFAILILGLVLGNVLLMIRIVRLEREMLVMRQHELAERARLEAVNAQLRATFTASPAPAR